MKINNKIIYEDVNSLSPIKGEEKYFNKKILITGCNGLIGTYLSFYFISKKKYYNCEVYLTSFSKELNSEKFDIKTQDNFNYFSWDINYDFPEEYKLKYDFVFYCSGYAQPSKFIIDPITTANINVKGTTAILNFLENKSSFIYMSSSEIYGNPDALNIPTKETYVGIHNLESNRAAYIYSKILGEILVSSYKDYLHIKICRISLTYGPGTSFEDERVLQQLIQKAINLKKIELIDDGSALRTYSYILDTIEMILNVSTSGKDLTYNIANPYDTISILDLANLVATFLNVNVTSSTIKTNNIVANNSPKVVRMSIEKYLNEYEKKEFKSMNYGVKNILKYFFLVNE
jgi:UDP-glucuronate decarboxylase